MRKIWLIALLACMMATSCEDFIPNPSLKKETIAIIWMQNNTEHLNIYVESEGLRIPNTDVILNSYVTPDEVRRYEQSLVPECNVRQLPVYSALCAYDCEPKDLLNHIISNNPDAKISIYECLGDYCCPKKGELLQEWKLSDICLMPYTSDNDVYKSNKDYFFLWNE